MEVENLPAANVDAPRRPPRGLPEPVKPVAAAPKPKAPPAYVRKSNRPAPATRPVYGMVVPMKAVARDVPAEYRG